MFTYTGKLLRVNLTEGTIAVESIDEDACRKYLGGRGLGTYYMTKEVDPTIDALSPENKVIIASGPLTGTPCIASGRYMVVTKSPLTGTIASSNSGGFWGVELKKAGYDMLIVEGKSQTPVYLSIKDDQVELRDATKHWGKLVTPTTEALLEESGDPKSRVLMIGPAGQRMSLIAAVMNDIDRAAGRSGVGAVMGSKNLLGVVARGTGDIDLARPEALLETIKVHRVKVKENGVTGTGLPTHGTAVLVNIINNEGIYPTNNWQESVFDKADTVSGEVMTDKFLDRRIACYRCPIACGRHCTTSDGSVSGGGPEYETLWAYTADCGVADMEAVIKANKWCNEYGMDTISAGCTIACAMEMAQKGYLKPEEMDGPPLEFGNAEAVVEWTRKMGAGEGLGEKMALGSARFAEMHGCPELSMTVKRQELPAYDPRGLQGQGLQYATSNRGGCHVRGYMISPEILGLPGALDRTSLEGKAHWARIFQDLTAVIDSLGLCLFTSFALDANDYAEQLSACSGWDVTADELMVTGDRIWNLERMFNLKAGIKPEEDTLPKRLLKDPIHDGPSKGQIHKLDQLLPEYYQIRGWSEGGVPTEAKLGELGLA